MMKRNILKVFKSIIDETKGDILIASGRSGRGTTKNMLLLNPATTSLSMVPIR